MTHSRSQSPTGRTQKLNPHFQPPLKGVYLRQRLCLGAPSWSGPKGLSRFCPARVGGTPQLFPLPGALGTEYLEFQVGPGRTSVPTHQVLQVVVDDEVHVQG